MGQDPLVAHRVPLARLCIPQKNPLFKNSRLLLHIDREQGGWTFFVHGMRGAAKQQGKLLSSGGNSSRFLTL